MEKEIKTAKKLSNIGLVLIAIGLCGIASSESISNQLFHGLLIGIAALLLYFSNCIMFDIYGKK